ncbi:hypothetical protein V5F77_20655 [Xanthobacter sp. DSM 24535]|uniref:hypothetical protein n=1 Tax=Roseixanthobacter psychrophilus TaxID=3119917 RepID=UPI003728D5E6
METGLAVIEARWWDDGNHSVRGLFESVCGLATGNPFSFRYDMFCDESSLSTTTAFVGSDIKFHAIYLAAHGDQSSLQGSEGHDISRTKLRNILRSSNSSYTLTGLYFGSCLICNENNAKFLLDRNTGINFNWIAGYSKSVDWVVSSCVDMIFWSFLIQERLKNRSRRRNKKNDLQIALHAASEMKKVMPTIFNELGFNMYHLDGGDQLTKVW